MSALARGEIVLEQATRSFRLVHERPRTLKELAVSFGRRKATGVYALRDFDLHVAPGEAVGMVGRNGAGKTSLLRCLAGIVPLDSGRAECGGRVVSLLELGAGFGQDFTGRENIWLNGALHGFSREDIEAPDRPDRRVLGAGRVHRRARQGLQLGDVPAARASRSSRTWTRTFC